MKLLLLGATGRTGKHILERGLSKGHQIVALARDPADLNPRDGLTIVPGTPLNADCLAAAGQGCDAILVALNNPRTSDAPWARPVTTEKILTKVARNIMALGDRRVVFLSAAGVGDSFEFAPWFMRFMIRRTNLRHAYADHNGVEQVFRDAGTRWTLVRAMGLSNADRPKTLIVGTATTPKPGMIVRRSAVADFMLDCAENDSHLQGTPVISER
ncbi:NAD(P)-dependent oxidoreductase [Paracoccus sp. R86501]|uniref:NAD(P)-dependent oxidoreductase n=1 Tax=Paracoccus sp. R86501 TaxID=3101711 RepID=UPI00366B589E